MEKKKKEEEKKAVSELTLSQILFPTPQRARAAALQMIFDFMSLTGYSPTLGCVRR